MERGQYESKSNLSVGAWWLRDRRQEMQERAFVEMKCGDDQQQAVGRVCRDGSRKVVLPKYEESKVKISINRDTLEVRVYADSTEALEQTACRFCAKTTECDHQIVKACFVPCG